MTLEQFKKMVAGINKNGNLPVKAYIIEDDYLNTGNVNDDLTFYDWEHDKETIGEQINLLFFKGYENYGE